MRPAETDDDVRAEWGLHAGARRRPRLERRRDAALLHLRRRLFRPRLRPARSRARPVLGHDPLAGEIRRGCARPASSRCSSTARHLRAGPVGAGRDDASRSSRPRPAKPAIRCSPPAATAPCRAAAACNGSAISRRSASMATIRRLGRRDERMPAGIAPLAAARRGRAGLAGLRPRARRAGRGAAALRHLRTRPQRLRQSRQGHGAAAGQAGPGVQPHPCRRHRRRAQASRARPHRRHLQRHR